ncbi:disks large homolog 5 [Protopterus annectens]|uniref:disks large homolog 5 n=1 Tax=Protopterus annectens TaxID=7888 RepID=UPI001CF9E899|nr:disks large homolog 5 [Protopterus annectens]
MDPKHKELLDRNRQKLVDTIRDVESIIELLSKTGILSPVEKCELETRCASSSEKVELLLNVLLGKDSDHFQDLCEALEKTNPQLLSTLRLNGGASLENTGSTYSVLSTMPTDSESSSSLSSIGTSGIPSSPPPPASVVDNRQMNEKFETVLFQLRQVTRERDELRKRLALSSPGSTFDDCRPAPKPSHDYERLKSQCMKAMSDLQSLQNQHTKTLKRCEEAAKEADFYHTLHTRLLSDQAQLKENVDNLKRENTQLVREHNHLKQSCEELKRLHDDDVKEITDLRSLQQQVLRENGSSEVLNKLYDTAMDKLEGVKKDYEALRKRYNEKVANHNTDLCRVEQFEVENQRLQKQIDMLMKERDTAVHFHQQYSSSLRRFDSLQQELNKVIAQNKELQREMERLQSELTRYKTLQLKALKDTEKYKEERDSVFSEYRLIMSERDQVIKEVDKLQTELELAEARLKNKSENRIASEEMEALRQELNSALVERDRAIFERNELLEKYCHEVQDKAEAQKELDQACKDIQTVKEERDVARKERTEAIIQRDQLLREYYQARQKQDSATLDMERANKEIEMLRKQYEAMSQELKEATQEAEVAKCRRDWAFQERDKIVAERESIRTLCDNLRRERDRAVSDLAEALRNLDDMRKQKNDAVREMKEMKEKLENQFEKEARFRQLMAHSSHDSAIDTDSLEWETEVVEFEKDRDDMDLTALGFDVAEGVNEPYLPGDCGIFVTKVDKGSIADGRLRVNDWLLKINDVDLTNKDKKQVIKAVLNGGGVINMVVRRRKSLGSRMITPVHVTLAGHKDSGISLESGIYVAAIAPGSPAVREGSLSVGDRIVAINGIALDNKSLTESEALLRSCRESLNLSLMKVFVQNSSWSGQNIFENLKDSEKTSHCRLHTSEIQVHNTKNLKHNSSTQTDIFSADFLDLKKDQSDQSTVPFCDHSPFSSTSLHVNSHRKFEQSYHSNSDSSPGPFSTGVFQDHPYGLADSAKRRFTFDPSIAECILTDTTLEKELGVKHSGGTWPKRMVEISMAETEQFTEYKMPKERQSIFDPDTFKRPLTPPKTDYMPVSQISSHSPQASRTEMTTPPTPPKRSDSFKFKHKPQASSASDTVVITGSPPSSPSMMVPPVSLTGKTDSSHEELEKNSTGFYCLESKRDCAVLTSRKPGEEDGSLQTEEPEAKRQRPKSAPPIRHKVAALPVPVPALQVHKFTPASDERLSSEQQEWVRSSPKRHHRYIVGVVPPVYSVVISGNVPRNLAPCPARTAIMRNPVYTAWSHRIHQTNCHPVPSSQICHPQSHPSPQHQGRLSLDLSHKPSSEFSETSRTRAPHGTNSLPSSARLGSSSNLQQYRTERIKIPPTPRYPRSVMSSDRGSLSHSECSSPSLASPPHSPVNVDTSSFSSSSQSQSSIATFPVISVSPVPAFGKYGKDRPYMEEPRHVIVHKGAEPLGISIVSGENGGIFVSKVTCGSIAHHAGLEYGDQLLEYNGINLRNATEQQARLIIGQQCDTITILAQYNPHMQQPGNHSHSSSHLESASSHSTSQGSGGTTPDSHSVIDTVSEQDEGTVTPPSKQTTPTTSPRDSLRASTGSSPVLEPRTVVLKKAQIDLVHICGGNLCGIFVEKVEDDSPVKGAGSLMPGDLLLEYGSVGMRNKTLEEAYLEMLKPAETITVKAQCRIDDFNKIKGLPGDGFYIRTLYDRVAEVEQDLSFKKDDILYVDDTLPQGVFGYWMAWQLDENAQKLERGQIPSKYALDQESSRRHSMSEVKDENGSSKTLSAAARRSFFRRKNKHKRSGSKDGKDLLALDAISTDSLPFFDDCASLAYQKVQRVDCTAPRPVLILGPLVDAVKDMLTKEAPGKFCRCPLEMMKASQQAIERGVKDCLFIDYKRRSGHFDVTTVSSIKEITEKDCHCLLDIAPHAIERLHSVQIYPIVIFIRYKNAKQIKEQKDPIFLRDKVTQKHSKEQFEAALKIEQEYSKYFTGVVQGGHLMYICTQIMTIVEQEQNRVLWIPAGCL